VEDLRQQVESELFSDILPFWLKHTIDDEHGGFRGQIANDLTIDPRADKGIILNARILWTFSRAYRAYRDPVYLATARRAYEYLTCFFWDQEFGGVYWIRAGVHGLFAGRVFPRHGRRRCAGQGDGHGGEDRVFWTRCGARRLF
jgi:mannose/cellobiose epimerase-like protein (N-acyl-D-glucosamine 2-epimerase family)